MNNFDRVDALYLLGDSTLWGKFATHNHSRLRCVLPSEYFKSLRGIYVVFIACADLCWQLNIMYVLLCDLLLQ